MPWEMTYLTHQATTMKRKSTWHRSLLVLAAMIAAMPIVLTMGCREPVTIEVPAPRPVVELYQWLLEDKALNESRSELREEKREVHSFVGPITEIDGSTVRFRIEDRLLQRDTWLECEFASERSILSLDAGQMVTLYGFLKDVDRVVKFDKCGFYGNSR
ncbi:MAG: hypothetical protein OXI91_13960 [Chloroflexota bacterium]|nr:hypothetical protein [Chloroflexota bacterium]